MVKNLPANAEDMSSVLQSERSPGEGKGNTLQYSCLDSPIDRRAWRAPGQGHKRIQHNWVTKEQHYNALSMAGKYNGEKNLLKGIIFRTFQ